jgi:hypothetical protein
MQRNMTEQKFFTLLLEFPSMHMEFNMLRHASKQDSITTMQQQSCTRVSPDPHETVCKTPFPLLAR